MELRIYTKEELDLFKRLIEQSTEEEESLYRTLLYKAEWQNNFISNRPKLTKKDYQDKLIEFISKYCNSYWEKKLFISQLALGIQNIETMILPEDIPEYYFLNFINSEDLDYYCDKADKSLSTTSNKKKKSKTVQELEELEKESITIDLFSLMEN